jgi:branched-subunit amino acid transport protein
VSTPTALALVGGCAVITVAMKAFGPVALGGRELPAWFAAIVAMMAPALFAALVTTQALADGRELAVGPDTAGVALAGVVIWRGGSMVVAVIVAAATTAALRAAF